MERKIIDLNSRKGMKSGQWYDHPDDFGNIILQRRKKEGRCLGCGENESVDKDGYCQLCIDEENILNGSSA
jgi:hypothetical protein